MQQEKQTKQIRAAIDELQQVPDSFVFNSPQVWTGLEQQLPGAKKKNAKFYYAAAAVLLITGTVYLGFMKNDTKQVLNTPTAGLPVLPQKKSEVPLIHQYKIQQQHNSTGLVQPAKKKVNQQINTIALAQKEPDNPETKEPQPIIVPMEQATANIPPNTELQKEEPKKLPVTVLSKPVPKKYKVIHINELNYFAPAPDPQNNLGRYEFRKLMQQQQEEKETVLPTDNHVKQLFFFKIKPTTTTTLVEN
jgi:hypothetical protein